MRGIITAAMLGMAIGWSVSLAPAGGQTLPRVLEEGGGSEEAIRQRQNQWTIGLAGGTLDGTWLRFADELARVLDDGDDMRVVPMITHGAATNVQDLLYLHGVDAAFTQADVLEYFRTQQKIPNIANRVQYILRLPTAELHVTARADIRSIEDLRGRKVVFGGAGTTAALTGPIVFQRLGIPIEPLFVDRHAGLKMLMNGEVAALLGSLPKPVDLWQKIPPDSGLHLLPVPYTKALAELYVLGEFTNADYPNLVEPGDRIDTIAVPSVLAVYNWPKSNDRYRRLERFVQYLFNRFERLTRPPFHPRWRDVNLAATVPGWSRFAASEEMVRRLAQNVPEDPALQRDFQTYLNTEMRNTPGSTAERDTMFRQFMKWREQQRRQ